MTEVIMPKMGDGMEEGTLLEWLKKDGESVKSGEVIGTIQTDKANLELEAPGSGVLAGVLIKAGETVPVGTPMAMILKEGESLPAGWGSGDASAAEAAPAANGTPAPTAETAVPAKETSGARAKVSPLARKLAEELGVNLESITGSGPGGRIVEKDIRAAAAAGPAAAPAPKPAAASPMPAPAAPRPAPLPEVVLTAEDRNVPLNRIRKITAERTTASKQQVPHFYVTVEVDVEKLNALRDTFVEENSGKVSVNDFVLKACALALQEMPQVNAVYQGDHITEFGAVNIGIAVALDDGLTVPVLKNAHALTLRQISAKARDLAGRARDGKLGLDELTGSTFSISNMGMLDVDNFGAIINQPNAAIIAIATARKKVVVTGDDEVEIRLRMNLTGSFDHRVVDGAVGARFMNLVRAYLENPTRLLA